MSPDLALAVISSTAICGMGVGIVLLGNRLRRVRASLDAARIGAYRADENRDRWNRKYHALLTKHEKLVAEHTSLRAQLAAALALRDEAVAGHYEALVALKVAQDCAYANGRSRDHWLSRHNALLVEHNTLRAQIATAQPRDPVTGRWGKRGEG